MDFAALSLMDIRKNVEDIITALEKKSEPFNTVNEVSTRAVSYTHLKHKEALVSHTLL